MLMASSESQARLTNTEPAKDRGLQEWRPTLRRPPDGGQATRDQDIRRKFDGTVI